jgi:hypothetical protein
MSRPVWRLATLSQTAKLTNFGSDHEIIQTRGTTSQYFERSEAIQTYHRVKIPDAPLASCISRVVPDRRPLASASACDGASDRVRVSALRRNGPRVSQNYPPLPRRVTCSVCCSPPEVVHTIEGAPARSFRPEHVSRRQAECVSVATAGAA